MNNMNDFIDKLHLIPHPEGGFYHQTHRSNQTVGVGQEYEGNKRSSLTSIYYLLPYKAFSAWHILKSDEVWYYHFGAPVEVHLLNPKNHTHEKIIVGNPVLVDQAVFQGVIEAGTYFAATPLQDECAFSVVGCSVGPGFEFEDFKLAERNELVSLFPKVDINVISRFFLSADSA